MLARPHPWQLNEMYNWLSRPAVRKHHWQRPRLRQSQKLQASWSLPLHPRPRQSPNQAPNQIPKFQATRRAREQQLALEEVCAMLATTRRRTAAKKTLPRVLAVRVVAVWVPTKKAMALRVDPVAKRSISPVLQLATPKAIPDVSELGVPLRYRKAVRFLPASK